MSPRRRKPQNNDLPMHLYFDASAGFRFRLLNGERVSLGHVRAEAIAIAQEYNMRVRGGAQLGVESLIERTTDIKGNFSAYIDKIVNRVITDEKPAHDSKRTLINDAERMKAFFINVSPCDISLVHVNDYLTTYHASASNNVYNRKIAQLAKVFAYAMDEGLMKENPARLKKQKPKETKKRVRLTVEQFKRIHAAAPLFLKTAMDLSLQTTHAVLEISRIQYKLNKAKKGECGCVWLKNPSTEKSGKIYGTLYIHRQKVSRKESSFVAIPIGETLKSIIDKSRDNIFSPYVVHKRATSYNSISQECDHATQFNSKYLSKQFSKVRDSVGICKELPKAERPTFHEIRALSAFLFQQNGINPQARMAHADEKSTKVYTQNHVEWVEVPHGEIAI